MQATTLSRKADRASAVNTDAALPANLKSVTALKHISVREQLQEALGALTSLSVAYGRFAAHPAKMTAAELAAQEAELQGFERQLAGALATLDRRRRALVSERSYRVTMPASARLERGQAVLI